MGPEERTLQSGRGAWLYGALLFCALLFSWLAMSPCLNNGFTNWDEVESVIQNPHVKSLAPANIKKIFSTPEVGMYTPLSTLSYALQYRLSGLDPRAYHAADLLLHLANTALVMLLAGLLLGNAWAAFLTALLFGIHPAHVESVAWAAERKDVLCAFFYLAALSAYAWRPAKAPARVLSLALFACALLAKSMAITLPLALLLVDYLRTGRLTARHFLAKAPFFVCAAVFVALQLYWSGGVFGMVWWKRLLFPLYNLAFYLYTLLWPFNLSAMYFSPLGGKAGVYGLAAAALAGLALFWKYLRGDRELVFCAAFYAALLLPVLQFFPFGGVIASDRYTYLPSIGVFMAGAVCAWRLWRRLRPGHRALAAAAAAAAVLTLAATARVRCGVWRDGVTLWTDTLRNQPLAAKALTNLCDAYLKAERTDEAAACLARAVQQHPGDNDDHYNVCRLFLQHKDLGKAEVCFSGVLEVSPRHAAALNYLGDISLLKGEPAKAEKFYEQAAQADGALAAPYAGLARRALARKDRARAALFYEKALAAEPADKDLRAALAALR
jgi:tetratricopeptide (TPR) repeat protein